MLILSRRIGEKIVINDEVTVTVLELRGKQVKLGFDAPKEIGIHRSEVYEKLEEKRLIDDDDNLLKAA